MIYTIAILMFAALGAFTSAIVAGLIGGITMPAAMLGALAAAGIGWVCACWLDRIERRRNA